MPARVAFLTGLSALAGAAVAAPTQAPIPFSDQTMDVARPAQPTIVIDLSAQLAWQDMQPTADEEPAASWNRTYVRPCVRSGKRLTC